MQSIHNYQHILAPVDGSKESEAAFATAVEIVNNTPSRHLYILNVVDTNKLKDAAHYSHELEENAITQSKALLERFATEAKQAGVTNLTIISETGNPKNIIAKVIPAQYDIDLIVIGATGMNAVERLMQGSVTEFVSRTSRVNTFIVHAD